MIAFACPISNVAFKFGEITSFIARGDTVQLSELKAGEAGVIESVSEENPQVQPITKV